MYEALDEGEYRSLHVILNQGEQCVCFMRHRPLKKMSKDPSVMIYGLCTNIIVMGLYYWGLYSESLDDAGDNPGILDGLGCCYHEMRDFD